MTMDAHRKALLCMTEELRRPKVDDGEAVVRIRFYGGESREKLERRLAGFGDVRIDEIGTGLYEVRGLRRESRELTKFLAASAFDADVVVFDVPHEGGGRIMRPASERKDKRNAFYRNGRTRF